MEYVYGALLLHKTGQAVTEHSLKKVIEATGKQPDEAKIKILVASLKEVDIDKELEHATIMSSAASQVEVKEEAKSETKKEEKASEAAEGLSSLFG